jgi:nucleoside-diphosphate-sugar epimerase
MALRVLYIGGTGQISLPCVEQSVAAGHQVTILNRGKTTVPLPKGVETLVGDMGTETYRELGDRKFDVVAQFRLYHPDEMKRDIATFSGKAGQYVFISSASVYQKPVQDAPMTERTKQENPFWEYSRRKTACEQMLQGQTALPYTIIRPSHTVRTHMPVEVGDADAAIRRFIAGKPVVVTGDGSSLWTLTRSIDVARAMVPLFGNAKAMNDDFHITTDRAFSWVQIHEAIARGFGANAIHAFVPTTVLVAYHKEWEGGLMGDKTWSALFDNSKVKSVVGEFNASQDLDEILAESVKHAKERLKAPLSAAAEAEDRLMDRIIAAQAAVRP